MKYDFSLFPKYPDFSRCRTVREMYGILDMWNKIHASYGTPTDPDAVREFRRARNARMGDDPLRKPLTAGWRSRLEHDGIDACGKDYRILPEDPNDPWTDAELTEYMHNSDVYCGSSRYDFDCTGERLTFGWHYTHTPAGVALIHDWYYNT